MPFPTPGGDFNTWATKLIGTLKNTLTDDGYLKPSVITDIAEEVELAAQPFTQEDLNQAAADALDADPTISALNAFKARIDPGSSGTVGQVLGWDISNQPRKLEGMVNITAFNSGVGDGTTDNTPALVAAFATGRPVFLPEGNYIFQRTEMQPGALVGAGSHLVTISAAPSDSSERNYTIWGDTPGEYHIEGVTIDATGNSNGWGGISLIDATKVRVRDVWVHNASRSGVYIIDSEDIVLDDCHVRDCGSTSGINAGGFQVVNGTDVVFHRCSAVRSGANHLTYGAGFFCPNATRIKFLYCDSYDNYVGGIHCDDPIDPVVEGCYLARNGTVDGRLPVGETDGTGVRFLTNVKRARVVNNLVVGNAENGIFLPHYGSPEEALAAFNVCIDNNVYNNAGGHGIEINISDSKIIGNYCSGNHDGISCNGDNVLILGNTCTNSIGAVASGISKLGHGIRSYATSGVRIIGNRCVGNEFNGIDLNSDAGVPSEDMIVMNNILLDNGKYGIELSDEIVSPVMFGNIIEGNTTGQVGRLAGFGSARS